MPKRQGVMEGESGIEEVVGCIGCWKDALEGVGWENLQSKRLHETPYLQGCADDEGAEKDDAEAGKEEAEGGAASCEKEQVGFLEDDT